MSQASFDVFIWEERMTAQSVEPSNLFITSACFNCSGALHSRFTIIRLAEVVSAGENAWKHDYTHEAIGICDGCNRATLFFLRIGKPGSVPRLITIQEVKGNLALASGLALSIKGQTPTPPKPQKLPYLPENVARSLLDAETSFASAHWNQAAAAYRKTVDIAITPLIEGDKEIKKHARPMLGHKLAALERIGDLPQPMVDWIRLVKEGGDFALHDDDRDFESRKEVSPARTFTRTLLEYLYVLPATIEASKPRKPNTDEAS
jgi:guanyl-specific ribonuclease Sa